MNKKGDLSKAAVAKLIHWRHADDKPSREQAISRLAGMIQELVDYAGDKKLKLAPFLGIGLSGSDQLTTAPSPPPPPPPPPRSRAARICPAIGRARSSTSRPALRRSCPGSTVTKSSRSFTNDAVVQGLSEVPRMTECSPLGRVDDWNGPGRMPRSPIASINNLAWLSAISWAASQAFPLGNRLQLLAV